MLREREWSQHRVERTEIASMQLDPLSERTTEATEDDKLRWTASRPGDVELIRDSPEWKLLHEAWKSWHSDPGTSKRSCLLGPAWDGYLERDGHQQEDSRPVPFEAEHGCWAMLKWFDSAKPTRHRVLQVRTSYRLWTVGLSFPDDANRSDSATYPVIVCSLDGQPIEAQQIHARLVYRGPQMKAGTIYHSERPEWVAQIDHGRARRVFVGHDGMEGQKEHAAQEVRAIAKPKMLMRRFFQKS